MPKVKAKSDAWNLGDEVEKDGESLVRVVPEQFVTIIYSKT